MPRIKLVADRDDDVWAMIEAGGMAKLLARGDTLASSVPGTPLSSPLPIALVEAHFGPFKLIVEVEVPTPVRRNAPGGEA